MRESSDSLRIVCAGSCVWRRLGHTSLDSNRRSGHGARELKSVRLDAPAGLLRLQLQRCHINALNPGNQVRRQHACIARRAQCLMWTSSFSCDDLRINALASWRSRRSSKLCKQQSDTPSL